MNKIPSILILVHKGRKRTGKKSAICLARHKFWLMMKEEEKKGGKKEGKKGKKCQTQRKKRKEERGEGFGVISNLL